MKYPAVAGLFALSLLAACAPMKTGSAEKAPLAAPCPDGVPTGARCLRGQDSEQALYLIVVPKDWNGVLVVHAHGGPALGAPEAARLDEDIKRWNIIPRAGYAWAASTFRQGGVAVRSAAEDTERVRRIFVEHVAQPKHTILHGQSWGGSVAAKTAEMVSAPGMKSPYDAVMLSSGVLGGGTRSYDFRLDLRVVYQALCHNHPKPEEPQYPLWMGLPEGSALTRGELNRRVDDCLGLRKAAAQRTAEQQRKVQTIVDVIHIPESSIAAHLAWGTWHFQDIVQKRTKGLNPFGNENVRYAGSPDDAALNASVLRYRADPEGVARFGADTDLSGNIGVPVLTVHAIHDPTAFVELESAFRESMTRSGQADHLVQTFTTDHEHSYLSDPVYPALLSSLLQWTQAGTKPTPQSVAAKCQELKASFGEGCRFVPDYRPPALSTRVTPRG
ncbi:hypothetical protein [Piscinibacter terrae]|uniref:Alpha/beta hydrolase n=1 Tax=Piscinibacter terrae TaxID=2496871 RepID=A0A3N7J2M7_9BURK|nr:hypothetical protein [Albitalea terrae]RQP25192.1 hypothetical protein DZC73_10145 [Albitalea terrae]